jgi:ubiquinone/menaquinone biosynthesis C-methylase UbiE
LVNGIMQGLLRTGRPGVNDEGMAAEELRRELSRRFYIRSRTARAAAVRLAYITYARALLHWGEDRRVSGAAARSLRDRIEKLFDDDWRDAEAGFYPRDLIDSLQSLVEYVQAAPVLLADLPRTRARIRREDFRDLPEETARRYPRYYARNFHYQTDGYLGHTSARLYDLQVELLFGGTADAMRRRLIPPIVQFARDTGHSLTRPLRVLDVACGTGHFLRMLGAALPDARLTGLDLSPHYLARARETLPLELDVSLVCDNAEKLPFVESRFDVVSSVFLMHEIPGEVRKRILAEMARVVRPGGLVIVADSIQLADAPELREQILTFPSHFHEPFYQEYVEDDLAAGLGATGLEVLQTRLAFLTKVVAARRPGTA